MINWAGSVSVESMKGQWELPQKKTHWLLWTLETRTHRSMTRLESGLPCNKSRDQHIVGGCPRGGEMDCDSQKGKGPWQQWPKKSIYYSYVLTCSLDCFGFFFFFPLSAPLLQLSILLALWNLIKLLRFLFSFILFFSQSHFLLLHNLCLYVRLLQFRGVFLFFSLFKTFIFLNLLLFFYIYPFVCFLYCSFPTA